MPTFSQKLKLSVSWYAVFFLGMQTEDQFQALRARWEEEVFPEWKKSDVTSCPQWKQPAMNNS